MLVDDIIAAFDALKNGETKTGVPLHDAADRCEGGSLRCAPSRTSRTTVQPPTGRKRHEPGSLKSQNGHRINGCPMDLLVEQ